VIMSCYITLNVALQRCTAGLGASTERASLDFPPSLPCISPSHDIACTVAGVASLLGDVW
jgi:hypothetical protein